MRNCRTAPGSATTSPSLSSGGVTQGGRVPDLAAPGDLGWALCTPDLELYEECTNDAGDPSPIQNFGGTSQSSPLVAGAAALVIQAYESTHHGVRPAPALVKRLLTSTAQDLGHPAYEQGAGLLNSLAAVRAAASWADSTATPKVQGAALVVNKTQLSPQGYPGTVQFQALSRAERQQQDTGRQVHRPYARHPGVGGLRIGDPEHSDRADLHRQFRDPAELRRAGLHHPEQQGPTRRVVRDTVGAGRAPGDPDRPDRGLHRLFDPARCRQLRPRRRPLPQGRRLEGVLRRVQEHRVQRPVPVLGDDRELHLRRRGHPGGDPGRRDPHRVRGGQAAVPAG